MNKFWKICGWGALAIVLLFALIMAVASPVAKYVVNNYGEDIVGRKLHAERVVINPFWGGVTIREFECKEQSGATNFVSFDRLYVQIAYPRLLAKNVKIRTIRLDGFNGQLLKNNERLNLTDIIERFTKKDTEEDEPEEEKESEWTVALDDIRINNSSFRYRDIVSDKQWKLEDISLRIPGLYFDNTQTNAGLEFGLPTGGRVGLVAGYRMQSNKYSVRIDLQDVHTDVVLPLVQDFLNVSGLGAVLNGRMNVDGSLDNINNIQMKGGLSMKGLSLRDNRNDEVAALEELRVVIDRGDLQTNTFILDSLAIIGITGDYEVHDTWNTLSRLKKEDAAPSETNAEPAPEEPSPASESKPLVWLAKKVKITGHDLSYHDYSMKNNWEYAIEQLTVEGSNIAPNGRNSATLNAVLTSDAQLAVDFTGGFDLAQQDTRLNMHLKGVQLMDFSALCRNYTGYSLDGGELMLDTRMDVTNGRVKGNNRIEIDHPRVGKKERFSKAPYKNIPVRTGFQLLTSAQDMILLDVPITGNAKNPKFSFGKVVSRALLKVFFGPLMGANDRNKSINGAELEQMKELLGEDSVLFVPDTLLSNDSTSQVPADVAVTAGDSVGLTEVSEQ